MDSKFSKEEEKILIHVTINRLHRDPRLDGWEKEFISSVKKQVAKGSNPSEKQTMILEKMRHKYAKKMKCPL